MNEPHIYLSEIIGKKVIGPDGGYLGRIKDLLVLTNGHTVVNHLLIKKDGQNTFIPLNLTDSILTRKIKLTGVFSPISNPEQELMLVKNVLDQQVVDIYGRKVVRVNDVVLAKVGSDLRVLGVDIGVFGILRRLGFNPLIKNLPKKILNQEKILPWEIVEPVEGGDLKVKIAYQKLREIPAADLADIIEDVGSTERLTILKGLGKEKAADAIEEVSLIVQSSIIKQVPKEEAVSVLSEMEPDKAADLLSTLPRLYALDLLSNLPATKASEIQRLLLYDEDTAGSLMTSSFVKVDKNLMTADVLELIHDKYKTLPNFYYIYVVGDDDQLAGVFDLRKLIASRFNVPVTKIMYRRPIVIHPKTNKKRVAQILTKYNLLAAPVVDKKKRILGVVKIDDLLEEFFQTEKV